MRFASALSVLVLVLVLVLATAARSAPLPRLNVPPGQVTLSGLSSGAFMAQQMLVAYSSLMKGAAVFAGGPYYCSKGQLSRAISICMNSPALEDLDDLTKYAQNAAAQGLIDPLSNLAQSRLYIFSSPNDTVVLGTSGKQIRKMMSQWMPESNIQLVESPTAEHGIPTLSYGNACADLGSPYLQNCAFDGIGLSLQHLYSGSLKPARELSTVEKQALVTFDQQKDVEIGANLLPEGLVFIPPYCKSGGKCRLHVAFHGCNQSSKFIGTVFAENAGYLTWAITNNLIVLFPQAETSPQNPKGCWDWFGYTGPQFATKQGPQMKAVRSFIQQLTGY